MELRDLVVTPLFILTVYIIAYFVRSKVTDSITVRYFFPALTVKIIGALAVGFVYQFYYDGGDTYAYHTHGSRVVWEALVENPSDGMKLLFGDVNQNPTLLKYSSRIWFFRDTQSYFVIRIATFFDLFTFSTYSATAALFAVLAFSGAWALFITFYKLYPELHRWIAFSCLFIPSVFFWGSGIFKDTITLAALGWLTFAFYGLAFQKKKMVLQAFLFVFSAWIIFSIKKYILLVFLPAILIWFFAARVKYIKSMVLKILLLPVVGLLVLVLSALVMNQVGKDDQRYAVTKLAETAKITAYDIRYGWGARTGEGSGYTLGDLDGTWQSMVPLIPKAINVSLFRPYLWEVKNPLMLLSALESLALLMLTVYLIVKIRGKIISYVLKPEILFCLSFALIFAFAVGISTYNFGTLSRYKIPMMPFYLLALGLIYYHYRKEIRENFSENKLS